MANLVVAMRRAIAGIRKGAEEVVLAGERLRDDHLRTLVRELADNTTVTKIDLQNNFIGPVGAGLLARLLQQNKTIVELSLYNNCLGQQGVEVLAQALSKPDCALQCLDLGWNDIGAEGADSLAEILKTNRSIKRLYLQNNSIGTDGLKPLAAAVETNSTLEILDIGFNQVTESNLGALTIMLEECRLIELNLSDNVIGPDGARRIAQAMDLNVSINSLNLQNTSIGSTGSAAIANLLMNNRTLRQLNLGNNAVCLAGAEALALSLKSGTSLESLILPYTRLGQQGVQVLANALQTNTSLRFLDISGNSCHNHALNDICAMLEVNPWLDTLWLKCAALRDSDVIKLMKSLESDTSSLCELDLTDNFFGFEGERAISDFTGEISNLNVIYFTQTP
mmetsp:Transcript_7889/g.15665  ORF Transcript_7889/g.15665 Transcript_7889/m.15665 type:complete len:394 (-) Transcript_7889:45-1226(-)|eukprot:CAMPEP_0171515778 /NCGR_PEP_ID=MMETSP0959-20130129/3657_1 /TAXON_ID=87120 /ORGANISM="Aurantiochytrium limacinum, Strain ATCCMYA-1381" /LENGTH=393 /DNA_ID=CAMNT_0012054389 /DNA_START=214 /DNA_END=1395 /DNA_ORIENTATION=-